ncbi:MAG: molybdopterin-binding protein [Mariprofundales bacterium]
MAQFATAAMVVIGNELLSGQTCEGNVHVVAKALFARGCRLREVAIIPDDHQTIVDTLHRLRSQVQAIITCGGIGPTHDDITMAAVSAALGVPILTHDSTLELMRLHYGEDQLNDGRRRMAQLPQGAVPIICPKSIAPGAAVDGVFVLAGVPAIFCSQLDAVLPQFGGATIHRHAIEFHGFESEFYLSLAQIQRDFPDVEIGSYPKLCQGNPWGNIVLTSCDQAALDRASQRVEVMLKGL